VTGTVELTPAFQGGAYESAVWTAELLPKGVGTNNFIFSVDVVGRVEVLVDGQLVLSAQSPTAAVATGVTSATPVALDAAASVPLVVLYSFILPPSSVAASGYPPGPTLNLYWESPDIPLATEIIPQTNVYHLKTAMPGYPVRLSVVNDPSPCTSHALQDYSGYLPTYIFPRPGDTSYPPTHGTVGRPYSPNLRCTWTYRKSSNPAHRLRIRVVTFDVEQSLDCGKDSLRIWRGAAPYAGPLVGSFCGTLAGGSVLMEAGGADQDYTIEFVSDAAEETAGFQLDLAIT